MSEIGRADDGLPADCDVGEWVDEKHRVLGAYLGLHAAPRANFMRRGRAETSYIDLFCGSGRAQVRDTRRFVDGSPIVAWKSSVEKKVPFRSVYIADKDPERRILCAERLRRLGAPVVEIEGDARIAAQELVERRLDPFGLHVAFIDPYSLGELRLEIIDKLARLARMDMLVHLSAMDLFRNLEQNIGRERREFDDFAPGWHEHVPKRLPREEQRRAVIDYWKTLIDAMELDSTAEMKPVYNTKNRLMYWLLLLSRHPLAQKFWKIVRQSDLQRGLDF